MKKVFFRIFAFLIDSIILGVILTTLIYCIPVFNNNKIKSLNEESVVLIKECGESYNRVDDLLEDSKINEDELEDIKEKYPSVASIFEDYSKKEEIKSDDLKQSIQDYLTNESKTIEYKSNKVNLKKNLLELVITILYFGVLQFVLKGQTLGKRIFRLYVVDESNNVPELYNFLLRSILTSTIVLSIISSIIALNTSENVFMSIYKYISSFSSFYVVLVFAFVLFRNDQKGLHDLILHTHIKLLNKDNTEYVEKVFNEEDSN